MFYEDTGPLRQEHAFSRVPCTAGTRTRSGGLGTFFSGFAVTSSRKQVYLCFLMVGIICTRVVEVVSNVII